MAVIYKKLGEIADISAGGTPKRSNPTYWKNGNIPWVKISDIKGKYLEKTEEFITEDGLNNSSAKLFKKGTLLYTIFATIGECAILNINASTNQAIAGINVKSEKVLTEYLYYFLKSIKNTVVNTGRGVAQNNINLSILKNIDVPLPEIEVQKKIINLLNKSNELVIKRKSQIEALDQLTQSVFLEMFGDPVLNNMNWNTQKLSETGQLKRGLSKHRPRNAPELLGGAYPLVQTGDISKSGIFIKQYTQTYSELGLKQSKLWPAGTLCITIAANIAETGILTFDACFPDSIVAYLPNSYMSNIYVHTWFSFLQRIIEANAPESAQKNINLKILSELEIPVPPFEKQKKFENFILNLENKRKLFEFSLFELENSFNSLMQRAFKGELFTEKEEVSAL
ncbi:restriction endonuclease subunit S [Weizmannia acidilactici]|uniref:restriction endonuclease subunit S n=1 Tax=Weizmannia acidilactici TaxID=2607726 RepID=UPI00124F0779|nr:restriction endonuclease subunit S [Weizmannia acidilactici]GER73645.1 hypothetical protein BpPP18_17120 [Weizmannia acidilactici]